MIFIETALVAVLYTPCLVKVSDDCCLKGGLARIGGVAVVVMGTVKGHTPGEMQAANYGELRLLGETPFERALRVQCCSDFALFTYSSTPGCVSLLMVAFLRGTVLRSRGF